MANNLIWADIPVVDLERAMNFYSRILSVEMKREQLESTEFSVIPCLE